MLALAERAGLHRLVAEHVKLPTSGGVNAQLKIPGLVAGMVAGADSIDDMDLLRHGGMVRLFGGVRAPSTLGTFLRAFTFGHVRQLDAVAARLLAGLARQAPLLAGANAIAYLDIDDTVKATYGQAKQGAGYGYCGVKGLNALIATVCTPLSAPVPEEFAKKYDAKKPTEYGNYQVATGPYMFKSNAAGKVLGVGYQPGKSATLVRNPNWNPATDSRPAYLNQIDIRHRPQVPRKAAGSSPRSG